MMKLSIGSGAKLTILANKKGAVLGTLDDVHKEVESINKSLQKVIADEEFTIRDSQEKILRAKVQLDENQKLLEVLTPLVDKSELDN